MDVKFQRQLIDLSLGQVEKTDSKSLKEVFRQQAERCKQELREYLQSQKKPKVKKKGRK